MGSGQQVLSLCITQHLQCFDLSVEQWCASLCFVSKKCFIILHAFDNSELIVMQDIYSHRHVTESTEQ